MSEPHEPHIEIGGHTLNYAQAMAVRVAITNFHMEVSDPEYKKQLGPISDLYRARLNEVLNFIFEDVG